MNVSCQWQASRDCAVGGGGIRSVMSERIRAGDSGPGSPGLLRAGVGSIRHWVATGRPVRPGRGVVCGRGFPSGAAGSRARLRPQHWRYHHVLTRTAWSSLRVSQVLLRLLLPHLDQGKRPLVLGIDGALDPLHQSPRAYPRGDAVSERNGRPESSGRITRSAQRRRKTNDNYSD